MKIEINLNSQTEVWEAKVWDGPDGIDHADFHCGSLGECFEEITRFQIMNGLTYIDDANVSVQTYFDDLRNKAKWTV